MNLNSVPGYLASKLTFHLMVQQAITGFSFDVEAAKQLAEHIKQEMKRIADEIEPKLPPRPLKKSEQADYTFPAKPFKKDGSLSSHGQAFLAKHNLTLIGIDHVEWQGELTKITGGKELPATAKMTLANQDDLKNWLINDCHWIPTLYNFQKDARGKPVRDKKGQLIPTSPKMQDKGRLCPNLEQLQGDLVKPVVTWLSLRNRLSVLENQSDDEKGWLNDARLAKDGRLSAGSSGIAATHRQKHTKVVNVPKAEEGVLLGKEFRALFGPRKDLGHVQVGFDASALEGRVEAHYCYPYPGGPEYADEILSGDPHTKNAFVFYPKQLSLLNLKFVEGIKDDPRFKPFRSKSKNGRYCLSYGGSPPKLAQTLGLPEHEGDELYEAFWNANLPLKMLKEKLTQFWETTGEKKWIKAIDGRKLYSRSKHSLVNLLFQSCGAIVMDYASLFLDKWLGGIKLDVDQTPGYLYKGCWVYVMGRFHDEVQISCPPEIAEEIGELGVKSIEKAGEHLKMRVPMTGEYVVGANWKWCH